MSIHLIFTKFYSAKHICTTCTLVSPCPCIQVSKSLSIFSWTCHNLISTPSKHVHPLVCAIELLCRSNPPHFSLYLFGGHPHPHQILVHYSLLLHLQTQHCHQGSWHSCNSNGSLSSLFLNSFMLLPAIGICM